MSIDILIVDDENDIRKLIKGILEDEGYTTRQANGSAKAYAEIEAKVQRLLDVFLDGGSKLRVSSVPNVDAEIYSKLEKSCMDFAYDTFVELKEKQMQQNEESFKKYMYALVLRQEAAEHIGIENIRRSRLQKLQKEKANIEAQHRKGSQVYPDFRLIMMARLEA